MTEQKAVDTDKRAGTVLITGGSGLIGRHLTLLLQQEGYTVSHLSRRPGKNGNVRVYSWDPEKGLIDREALMNTDCIIHLAGANIGERRWTTGRRKEIIDSRIAAGELLSDTIRRNNFGIKTFISASAIGYYGSETSEKILTEDDAPSSDFLGKTCRLWEESATRFEDPGIRTVIIRTSVVLDKNEGALEKILRPAKYGLIMRLGSGKQYFPWIHISDLCNIYLKAVRDINMKGPYNAVAPQHVNHDEFAVAVGEVLKRPVFLPHVPEWLIRIILGEMSVIVLNGSRISSGKITSAGYKFNFPLLYEALKDILSH